MHRAGTRFPKSRKPTAGVETTWCVWFALLLGPLTVEPSFRSRGVGRLLLERALRDAKARGHRFVLLVGDEAYYRRIGFKAVPEGRATMPGPVDYSRLLFAELVDGAFDGVSGAIRPDWDVAG